MQGKPPIRVLIADDHRLFAQGLTLMLEKAPDLAVVATAKDGMEAVELVERFSPDVVLMDLSLPLLDGWGAIARIRANNRNIKIIVLTMNADGGLVSRARELGVQGYLFKDTNRLALIAAIRAAASGKRFFDSVTGAPLDPVET